MYSKTSKEFNIIQLFNLIFFIFINFNASASAFDFKESEKIKNKINEIGFFANIEIFNVFSEKNLDEIYVYPRKNNYGKLFSIGFNNQISENISATIGIGKTIENNKYVNYSLSTNLNEYGEIIIGNQSWPNSLIRSKVRQNIIITNSIWQNFGYREQSMRNRIENLVSTEINANFKEQMKSPFEESFFYMPRITYVNSKIIPYSTVVLSNSIHNNIIIDNQNAFSFSKDYRKEPKVGNMTSIGFLYEKEIHKAKFAYFTIKEESNNFFGFNHNGFMIESKNTYNSTGAAVKFKNFFFSYELGQWNIEGKQKPYSKINYKQPTDYQREIISSYEEEKFQIIMSYYSNRITQDYLSQKITSTPTIHEENNSLTKLDVISADIEFKIHPFVKPFIQICGYKETEISLVGYDSITEKDINYSVKNILLSMGIRIRTF